MHHAINVAVNNRGNSIRREMASMMIVAMDTAGVNEGVGGGGGLRDPSDGRQVMTCELL